MKDFQLRNETRLLFRNDPTEDIAHLIGNKKALFVYGGGSARKNGCYEDVSKAASKAGATLYELPDASRELEMIQNGIHLVKKYGVELIIGAGGAQVMDCSKLIAFGTFHETDLWDYVKGKKNPYGLEKLPLILIPTYPSSGSEYDLGAVSADAGTGDFGTAYGIGAETAILVPKYSLSLSEEMTAYTGLVTLVQLSASVLGDRNKLSYDIGVSVMRNVLDAVKILKEDPKNVDARGVILYGAALSTSGRLGLGKEENYAYDIYEVEFIPEVLFGVPYRQSLTTLFPRFLEVMAKYHEDDIRRYFKDVYGFNGDVASSVNNMVALFGDMGVKMYFEGSLTEKECLDVKTGSLLKPADIFAIMTGCLNIRQ